MTDDMGTGLHKMEKMCAQANPAATSVDGCAKETHGTTTVTRCGCQIEDFCNGDGGLARLMAEKPNVQPGIGDELILYNLEHLGVGVWDIARGRFPHVEVLLESHVLRNEKLEKFIKFRKSVRKKRYLSDGQEKM